VFFFCSILLFSQNENRIHQLFEVKCLLPDVVESGTEFMVEFEITKAPGYVGPLTITQKLPSGFRLNSDSITHAELSSDHQKFEIFWEHLPLGNTYAFTLKFSVGNIAKAVYPFHGMAYFYGISVPYGSFLIVDPQQDQVSADGNEGHIAPVEISFELPEEIIPDIEFTFITSFKKSANYFASGRIIQKWPDAFQPIIGNLPNASMDISDNTVAVSWDKLGSGTYFSIAYQVKVKEFAGGVYPVITEYEDETGLKLVKNLGILISAIQSNKIETFTKKQASLNQLWFEYPKEVIHGSEFDFTVFIQKGKNTGPGRLWLMLPSGCSIKNIDAVDFTHDVVSGALNIQWGRLPASPVVEVQLSIETKNVRNAVYLILSEFYQSEQLLSSHADHLFISEKAQFDALNQIDEIALAAKEIVDTVNVFSRIDSLLMEWKKASGGSEQADQQNTEVPVENFRVQILASKKPLPNVKRLLLSMNITEPLNVHFDGEYYRYTVGEFKTAGKCSEYVKFIQGKGFADAFLRKYLGDEPAKE